MKNPRKKTQKTEEEYLGLRGSCRTRLVRGRNKSERELTNKVRGNSAAVIRAKELFGKSMYRMKIKKQRVMHG